MIFLRVIVRKKNKSKIFFKVLLLVILGYVVFCFINLQISINKKRVQLKQIQQSIIAQNIKNKEINNIINSTQSENQEYIEQIAREDLDFAKDGEKIFINISGN